MALKSQASRPYSHPGYIVNRYYVPATFTGAGAAGGIAANFLFAVPVFIAEAVTIHKLGANVTTAGSAGSKFRLGLYHNSGGVPGAAVYRSGELALDAIAEVEDTVSISVAPGWYWLAIVFSASASITLHSTSAQNVGLLGQVAPGTDGNVCRVSYAYAALPATFPAVASTDFYAVNAPLLWWRKTS